MCLTCLKTIVNLLRLPGYYMLNREHNHDLLSSWGYMQSGNLKFIFLDGTVLKGGNSSSLFYNLISVNFSGLEERFVLCVATNCSLKSSWE